MFEEREVIGSGNSGFGFLEISPGRFAVGTGGFRAAPEAPSGDGAFYVNDFELSDEYPWKVPEQFDVVDERDLFVHERGPEVKWEALGRGAFEAVFREIKAEIVDGGIRKTVPVITERGRVETGDPREWMGRLAASRAPLIRYGYLEEDAGILGATPEELFALRGEELRTMALAGTAAAGEREEFEKDAKEIEEHELVAQHIIQHVADLGVVTREARESMDVGAMVHFLTRIDVRLARPRKIGALIQRLHPTPALGAFPRTMESLRKLQQYRDRMDAPAGFGAPFGVSHEGGFRAVVSIRNVSWRGKDVYLPSGCGVIEESGLESEWRELALKRESVKRLLSL
ncbi:MAG: chorismate-binding protein [Verrucomicrobiota bacterium]